MDALFKLGVNVILALQGLGNWPIAPMKFFSFLGYEEFYLFVMPALYWCFSASLGLRVGLLLMTSGGVNAALKLGLHDPRPYWYDLRVHALSTEASFGLPSGHAQNAVAVWGRIAAWFRRPWAWVTASALIFLIGLSRLYLGVHFPSDVLAGWLAGLVLLAAFMALERPVAAWLARHAPWEQALLALVASLLLLLPVIAIRISLSAWSFPAEWSALAAQAAPEDSPITPFDITGAISNAGVFFGLALGAIMLRVRGGFSEGGPWAQRGLRFLLGAAGVLVIWYGLGKIFPRSETLLAYALRYLRYALVGAWVAWLAPVTFIALGLSHPAHPGRDQATHAPGLGRAF